MNRAAAVGAAPDLYHGGDLDGARKRFPLAPEPWIDLSTGVNPVPYPVGELPPDLWRRLPSRDATAALEAAAARAWSVPESAGVVAAPGTQAIIQWLPLLAPARSVAILGPTYGEHEHVWRRSGARVDVVVEPSQLAIADVAVVVNPNNPDGRLVPIEDLVALAESLGRRGGLLVVDEAFMDMMPRGASLSWRLPTRGAIALRSFGKAYGLAGVRLGFALAEPILAARLRAALGPWAVSGPALHIGRRALEDQAWLAQAALRLIGEAHRLDGLLKRAGFSIVGGTPLYRLTQHARASDWHVSLCEAGILTRPFPAQPDRLRFGVPHAKPDWARVTAALARKLPPKAGR